MFNNSWFLKIKSLVIEQKYYSWCIFYIETVPIPVSNCTCKVNIQWSNINWDEPTCSLPSYTSGLRLHFLFYSFNPFTFCFIKIKPKVLISYDNALPVTARLIYIRALSFNEGIKTFPPQFPLDSVRCMRPDNCTFT